MRIFMHRGRRWLAATAAVASLGLVGQAQAQYAPYTAQPSAAAQPQYGVAQPQYGAAQPQYAPVQPQYNPYVVGQGTAQAPAQQPQYAAQGAYAGYAAAQSTPVGPTPGYAPAANYASRDGAPRVAMAYQGGAQNPQPTLSEPMTLTPPIETVGPGVAPNGVYAPQPMPESHPAAGAGMGYAPGGGYESYPAGPAAGCNTCNTGSAYGACDTSGACNTYSTYGGMGGALGKHAGCGYWFGGVYGLLMDRDNSNKYPLVFTAPSMPVSSYPTFPPNVVLNTRDADIGYQGGVEFRLGRTFGCGPVDPCSCACGPRWGLEAAYWTLFEDDAYAQYVDQGTIRTYTMMPMYGLLYDNGSGDRPVNEYWDHAPPTQATTDIEVRLARVRSNLEVHNVEVNLLRLSVCGGGSGAAACDVACGPGCDTGASGYGCSGDACATGYAACGPRVGSRYSCTGVCGFRWMQIDEAFSFGVDFDNTGTVDPLDGFLDYWANVENNFFGAQIGCNGMYRIGCKWGLHLNTLFGLYGNDIDVRQYFNSPTGQVSYTVTGEDFGTVNASKTDVAMLGELRLGASYQASCHCRLYGGWRAIGITGIALATDQTPVAFLGSSQMLQYVNSNGSMILHGLQTGVEWNY